MKKSTLALSLAAAIGSFGFVGNAMAIGQLNAPTVTGAGLTPGVGTVAGPTTATQLVVNADGIGHQLVVPYFSAQSANTTLLNIANTDTVNGKVVKVRFRGAANSDDLFDFQLLLSPGDIWSAGVTQDPVTGLAMLKTGDASCTLPATVKAATGALFSTGRVDPTPAKGNAANETREGYIEIIAMADIPPTAFNAATTAAAKALTLYGTTKHVANVAACDATVLTTALGTDFASLQLAADQGLSNPTGKLTADWVIMNQTNTAAWSGSATALQAQDGANLNAAANLVFWPQKDKANNGGAAPLLAATAGQLGQRLATSDPLFVTGAVVVQPFDLPDLSTPYVTADSSGLITNVYAGFIATPASVRADLTSGKLAVKSITNQFVTNSGIGGVTDMLFSQPTRRYSAAVNYTAGGTASPANDIVGGAGTRAAAVFRDSVTPAGVAAAGTGSAYYTATNLPVVARQLCLNSVSSPSIVNREESVVAAGGFVISPNVAAASTPICGEAAILSINSGGTTAGSAMNATVVRNDVTFQTGFDLGSALFDTSNGVNPLPILAGTFMRVANGAVNYGFTIPSKVTR